MCIRDRRAGSFAVNHTHGLDAALATLSEIVGQQIGDFAGCLLYTSDAADERSSVDLGGRRIIKKKNNINICHNQDHSNKTLSE